MEKITQYIKGTKCRNASSKQDFVCSGKYSIDEDGIWDTENLNYIYMPKVDYWAEIIPSTTINTKPL